METGKHASVLLQEVIDGLALSKGSTFLDATLGGGGHSAALCEQLGSGLRIIGFDADSAAIERSRARIEGAGCTLEAVHANFRLIDEKLTALGVGREVDGALFDLGLSSFQLDAGDRGFSFRFDEPLSMQFSDAESPDGLTAAHIVNEWSEEQIATIIHGYGEERFARRIAKEIVEAREQAPIETSAQLAEIVRNAVPGWYARKRIHPATKTFQALRITVNDELDALADGLAGALQHMASGGRVAVISFHSLEDRIVKRLFRDRAQNGEGTVLTKKPIHPKEAEMQGNPRARSAKLRLFQRT